MKIENEIWADIKGYDGLYKVSNFGNVKSLSRMIKKPNGNVRVQEKILKQNSTNAGYLYVVLVKDTNKKNQTIHRLVAENFLDNKYKMKCVNHIDGNKKNNNIDNLEWCSYSSNHKHAYKNHLMNPRNGEDNTLSKLKNENILFIRNNYPRYSQKELALMFGVHQAYISQIILRKKWKHI